MPAIPTAKSVTIARVASPVSINRRYQTAFLDSLKNYLASAKRLVKANDFIAIPLCSDDYSPQYEEDEDQSVGDHM
jgi:peroxin-6